MNNLQEFYKECLHSEWYSGCGFEQLSNSQSKSLGTLIIHNCNYLQRKYQSATDHNPIFFKNELIPCRGCQCAMKSRKGDVEQLCWSLLRSRHRGSFSRVRRRSVETDPRETIHKCFQPDFISICSITASAAYTNVVAIIPRQCWKLRKQERRKSHFCVAAQPHERRFMDRFALNLKLLLFKKKRQLLLFII